MENKINLVEILKDCPSGMELDCALWDSVTFKSIKIGSTYPIIIAHQAGEDIYTAELTEYGCWNCTPNAKCIIFPKGKTSWEGFIPPCQLFKDGDIVVNQIGKPFILKSYDLSKNNVCSYCGINRWDNFELSSEDWTCARDIRYATEEEKAKLFDVIKANGYRWNEETKNLEKIEKPKPKFKIGNRIQNKEDGIQTTITKIHQDCYECDNRYILKFENQDNWELVPNKFDINTLIPFESRVLVRDFNDEKWIPGTWGFYDKDVTNYPYIVCSSSFNQCIPYEGNEHLLGKTNDCSDYYKNW